MLRALNDKVGSTYKQMGNVSRETGILQENQKEMLESKTTAAGMKNAIGGPINSMDIAKGRTFELKDMATETSKKRRDWQKGNRIPRNCGTTTNGMTYLLWKHWKEKKDRKEQKRNLKQK